MQLSVFLLGMKAPCQILFTLPTMFHSRLSSKRHKGFIEIGAITIVKKEPNCSRDVLSASLSQRGCEVWKVQPAISELRCCHTFTLTSAKGTSSRFMTSATAQMWQPAAGFQEFEAAGYFKELVDSWELGDKTSLRPTLCLDCYLSPTAVQPENPQIKGRKQSATTSQFTSRATETF